MKNKPCKRTAVFGGNDGFTLVEIIVAGIISVLISGVLYTIFQMNCQMVSTGALNSKVQVQYETAMSQISTLAHQANQVISSSESWPVPPNAAGLTGIQSITMVNSAGTTIGGYRISGTVLQELVSGTWTDFHVGSSASPSTTVKVTSGSNFSLSGDRRTVKLNITVTGTFGTLSQTISSRKEVYLCRN